MDLSIVIPVYNEEKNVALLHQTIRNTLDKTDFKYEIIFVDDGSTDNTFNILNNLKKVKIIKFRKNFGQTAAMMAGFENSNGKVIVSLDGDLQNDPSDIPKLLDKLNEGYDVVSGWRYNRQDSFGKKTFSKIANSFRQLLVKDPIHDSGCSLRAYKKECFSDLQLHGEMHRYIPAILAWKGFKLDEVKVNHLPRKFGKTKYNMWRVLKGFMDLINVWFWRKYSNRPLHIFGGFGIILSLLGFILGLSLIVARQFYGLSLGQSQLPLLAVLMVVIGVQFFISGLMADISIKNYYSNGRRTYSIEKIVEK
ncbi:MAG TPA: glycosyltransferase family 2 protein [Candidatus Nanoarchaeia archaeon]|nr:glycosyltransferase family 2 protein [Candidatus Nanoarchaeia archaeon]